ncbi:MAG: GNAT family N-acetyltransferase [Fidelibacterota bacterium]
MNRIFIRPFTMDDYEVVCDLWNAAKLPFKPKGRDSKTAIRNETEKSNSMFFMAELDHQVIGVIFGTHDGRKGWINRLAVRPEVQRNGVAKKLVQVLESALEKEGIHITSCLIEDGNESSVAFFKKMGYVPHDDIQYFSKRKSKST